MPDLNFVPAAQCVSNSYYQASIEGSKGDIYTVVVNDGTSHCDCPGFKYRNRCSHVAKAVKDQCTWHSQFDEEQTEKDKCPRCGGPVEYVRFAI